MRIVQLPAGFGRCLLLACSRSPFFGLFNPDRLAKPGNTNACLCHCYLLSPFSLLIALFESVTGRTLPCVCWHQHSSSFMSAYCFFCYGLRAPRIYTTSAERSGGAWS